MLLLIVIAAAMDTAAGVVEFARYYGYYNDAQEFNQTAAAFGANPENLKRFKEQFRWAKDLGRSMYGG